jgi:hypothetical protein
MTQGKSRMRECRTYGSERGREATHVPTATLAITHRVIAHLFGAGYANVCTITGPAVAVAGPTSKGARLSSIHASTRLFDSSAPA